MEKEFDSLTRLPERGPLLERLDHEIARAERYSVPLSLLLADVNGFSVLKAVHGLEAGEAVLRRLALALLSSTHEADMVARVGVDTFAVLLPDTDSAGATSRAARLSARIAATDMGEHNQPLFVTMSVGVATLDADLAESAALMTRAEEALRVAKQGSANAAPGTNVAPGE